MNLIQVVISVISDQSSDEILRGETMQLQQHKHLGISQSRMMLRACTASSTQQNKVIKKCYGYLRTDYEISITYILLNQESIMYLRTLSACLRILLNIMKQKTYNQLATYKFFLQKRVKTSSQMNCATSFNWPQLISEVG